MEEFHETFHNLQTCPSCPPILRCLFFLKELCGALAHRMMYSLPYLFFCSVWYTCPSHRKPAPHDWLGRMVRLCTQDCSDPLLSFRTVGLPVPRLLTDCPFALKQRDLKIMSVVKFPYV